MSPDVSGEMFWILLRWLALGATIVTAVGVAAYVWNSRRHR